MASDDSQRARAAVVSIPQRVSRHAARTACAAHLFEDRTRRPRRICSAWPPGSIRWSSASRRFSVRSRKRIRPPQTALHRADAEQAVPLVVRRRQTRANRDRARRRAPCRSASPPSRWRERSSASSRAARVLVVGAGEISTLTAQHLQAQGVGRAVITSRTAAHAEALAASVGGRAVPWDELGTALVERRHRHHGDRLAAADHHARAIVEAMNGHGAQRPLFIIDIAVPRDVEAAVGDIEQVFLYNIDDLQTIVQENLSQARHRGRATPKRSSPRKSRSSSAGNGPAARCRRSWRCGSGSTRFGAVRAAATRGSWRPAARGACARRRDDAAHRREAAARTRPSS